MTPGTIAALPEEVVYPPELADRSGWMPSTITTPITPLEFDLRAKPFARGFRRGLRDLIGPDVEVGVRRRAGHLFTLVTGATAAGPGVGRHRPPDDFREHWLATVEPRTRWVLGRLADLAERPLGQQLDALASVGEWLEELTYLHHTMLIPARAAIAEFAELVVGEGLLATELDALGLLAGFENATSRAAQQLWSLRHVAPEKRAGRWHDLAGEVSQEGEGYGLRWPGWIEDPTVPSALADLYRAEDAERAPAECVRRAAERRLALRAELDQRLVRCGRAVRIRFAEMHSTARSAVAITEDHAPLMHARLSHELRRYVMSLGCQLTAAGALDEPVDVVRLHLDDLAGSRDGLRSIAAARRSEDHPPAPPLESVPRCRQETTTPVDETAVAAYVHQVFGGGTDRPSTAGVLQGEPASPGAATGPVRRLRRQLDFASIEPGDVVIAPNNSSVWSFALPAAAAVIAPGGSQLGHLASLARDYHRPAIVAMDADALDRLQEGDLAEVDGHAGTLRHQSIGRT